MKTKLHIFSIVGLLLISSCSDFLDQQPDDILTEEMVFNEKKRTEEWLAGIYNQIPDPIWGYGRDSNIGIIPLSDEIQIPIEWGQFDWWQIGLNQGNWNPTSNIYDLWGEVYKTVRSAYIFIDKAKVLPEQKQTREQVDMMKLEARFLIAYSYMQMLEIYGPFPLVTSLVPTNPSLTDLMIPRTPYDEIVNWLDNEFSELALLLPEKLNDEVTRFGRPTKGIALACRARLWLFAASPLFNGNSTYAQIKNPDGTPLFPETYDPNKWRKAADATRELLNLAETGVYQLYKEYYNNQIDPFMSYQNLFLTTAEINGEIIFARPDSKHDELDKHCMPRGFGGFGAYGVTQEQVDAYYMRNGLPITNNKSGYSETGFSTEESMYNTAWNLNSVTGKKGMVTPPGTFNMYVDREPRFYVSVLFNGQLIRKDERYTEFYYEGRDGRPSFDSPPCGYLVRKRVHPESEPRRTYFPYRPGIIFRLGEYYLNYAEALNECDPTNPDILKYLNLIRERSGIPAVDASLLGNKDSMRTVIHAERRVELAMEGHRYQDMRRWLIAEDIFKKPITGMNTYGNQTDFYKRITYMNRKFDKKMYLWPIKQSYIDNNPNLTQNPFW